MRVGFTSVFSVRDTDNFEDISPRNERDGRGHVAGMSDRGDPRGDHLEDKA
jgi:hypothetical protein